jgi:hypothetical protein
VMWIKISEWLAMVVIIACVFPFILETIDKLLDRLIAKEKRRTAEIDARIEEIRRRVDP